MMQSSITSTSDQGSFVMQINIQQSNIEQTYTVVNFRDGKLPYTDVKWSEVYNEMIFLLYLRSLFLRVDIAIFVDIIEIDIIKEFSMLYFYLHVLLNNHVFKFKF
jgi:hypothetical protein